MDPEVPGSSPGGGTTRHETQPYFCAHARYAAYAAARSGLTFRALDGGDGYLFEVADNERGALFSAGAGSPYALNDGRAASIARDKQFTAQALEAANVPCIPGKAFFVTEHWAGRRSPGREREDALAHVRALRFPIFCKPVNGSNGVFAEVVHDLEAFTDYMRRVASAHFAILVQPYVSAPEYRVLVLQGRSLCAYAKRRPVIVGDGQRTLQELAQGLPREYGCWPPNLSGLSDEGERVNAGNVPPLGTLITLEGAANRSLGGASTALFDDVPRALSVIALRAAHALGLGFAGVDIFDVSPAQDLSVLQVIEVNYNPMIATLEDHGRWDLIEVIWRANFAAAFR